MKKFTSLFLVFVIGINGLSFAAAAGNDERKTPKPEKNLSLGIGDFQRHLQVERNYRRRTTYKNAAKTGVIGGLLGSQIPALRKPALVAAAASSAFLLYDMYDPAPQPFVSLSDFAQELDLLVSKSAFAHQQAQTAQDNVATFEPKATPADPNVRLLLLKEMLKAYALASQLESVCTTHGESLDELSRRLTTEERLGRGLDARLAKEEQRGGVMQTILQRVEEKSELLHGALQAVQSSTPTKAMFEELSNLVSEMGGHFEGLSQSVAALKENAQVDVGAAAENKEDGAGADLAEQLRVIRADLDKLRARMEPSHSDYIS